MTAATSTPDLSDHKSVADTPVGRLTDVIVGKRYGENSKRFKDFQKAVGEAKKVHVQFWALLELIDERLKNASEESKEKFNLAKQKIQAFLQNKDYNPNSVQEFIFGRILPKAEKGILDFLGITKRDFLNKIENVDTRMGKETPPKQVPPTQSLILQFADKKVFSNDVAAAIVAFQWASRALCIANDRRTPPEHWAPRLAASDPMWLRHMCNEWSGEGYAKLVSTAQGVLRPPEGGDESVDFNKRAKELAAAGFTRARDELYHAGYHDLVKKITKIMIDNNLKLNDAVREPKSRFWELWKKTRAPGL